MINVLIFTVGILLLVLIILGVYNIVVRKKKVNNMYTPFDDAIKGTKDDENNSFK